eukprot:3936883-Rhodomonas_salina.1
MTWHELRPSGSGPSPRRNPALTASRESLFLFGGSERQSGHLAIGSELGDMYEYRVASNHWQPLAQHGSLPPVRECPDGPCMGWQEEKLYLFGGSCVGQWSIGCGLDVH